MDRALIERNARHFYQASETPFAQSPLKDLVPPLEASNDITQRILIGDLFDLKNQSTIINDLFQNLE